MVDTKWGSVNTSEYESSYTDESFWDKIGKYAKKAGSECVLTALKLYYAFKDPRTPMWAKSVIVGALGYFISPVDLIPDVIPVIGFVDDVAVLGAAALAVATHIEPEHVKMAEDKLEQWFG